MKALAFGEILLRLKAPGQERLFQTPALEATFGGSEANVAVSLANFSVSAGVVTVLPDNAIGRACLAELRRFGLDVSQVRFAAGRMGTYYLEEGANQLPAKVLYDRDGSAIALAPPASLDWEQVLDGVDWFHVSGITPAISQNTLEMTRQAIQEAKKRGITVSFDYNYRENLWKYGVQAEEALRPLSEQADVLFASEYDLMRTFGLPRPDAGSRSECCRILARQVLDRCPAIRVIATTLRTTHSAEDNTWTACLHDRQGFYHAKTYPIRHIVDRIGAGDAFAGGLIYGLDHYQDGRQALEFATAAACLKHSIPGDINRVDTETVEELMAGEENARIRR